MVDVETLKKTNEDLIFAIEETISIQEEGRAKRQEAEREIGRLEEELKNMLQGIKKEAK